MDLKSNQLEEIFHQALRLPTSERVRFAAIQSGDDKDLYEEVVRLLTSHAKNESDCDFLEGAPVSRAEIAVTEIAESVGDIIGRYKLLEKIGEGGMGVVYMAEQVEGVRRRVALKIIKLGMDTRQVIARFEAERQAMALFDHPNITKVFDAGSTNSGRPFFVMELVRGTSVVNFVNKNNLNLNSRLKLFVDICKAVQHAHQKGIIHRDLKPSNILVTLFDGVPVPKVIDFGIAKAIGHQRLTEKTLFTRYAAMVGTPQYMSPEQAELNGMDVDTRSDIYSLGVLLYELITGSTPISEKDLNQLNPLALYETLRESEIETPSSRLIRNQLSLEKSLEGHLAEGELVANPVVVKPTDRLKGDLDWVVMKALARDRTRRYASTNELAEDVSRFLEGMPVLAAPPSPFYKLQNYVRRNRAAIIAATIGALVISAASVACVVFGVNAYQSNRELLTVNRQLSDSIEQLKTAESKIRANSEAQQYKSALEVATFKFEMDFQSTLQEVAERVFPDQIAFKEFEIIEVPDSLLNGPDYGASEDFVVCITFDKSELLGIPHQRLLGRSLNRLKSIFDEEKKFYSQVYGDDGLENDDSSEHQHSKECLEFRDEANAEVRKNRHEFFGLLVGQYRKAFGENDPRVAEAINLHASSLIAADNLEIAEARLRESLALAKDVDRKNAAKLLSEVRERCRKINE